MINLQVIGNIGKEPTSKEIGGKMYISFSLAVNKRVRGVDETTWIDVLAEDEQFHNVEKYLMPGAKLYVTGAQSISQYTSKSGENRVSQTIWAKDIQIVLFAKRQEGGYETAIAKQIPKKATSVDLPTDDLPF